MQSNEPFKMKIVQASLLLWISLISGFVGCLAQMSLSERAINIELEIFRDKTQHFLHLDWMQSSAMLNMFGNVEKSLSDETSKIVHTAIIHTDNRVLAGFGKIISLDPKFSKQSKILIKEDDVVITLQYFSNISVSFLIAKNYWINRYPYISDLSKNGDTIGVSPNFSHIQLYTNIYSLICFISLLIASVTVFFLNMLRSEKSVSLDLKQKVHDTRSELINTLMLTRIADKAISGDSRCKAHFLKIKNNQKLQKRVSDVITFPSEAKVIDVVEVANTAVSFVNLDLNTDYFDVLIPNTEIKCYANESFLLRILINLLRNSLYAIASKPGYRSSFEIIQSDKEVRFSISNNGQIRDLKKIEKIGYSTNQSTGLGMSIIHEKLQAMNSKLNFNQDQDKNTVEFYFSLELRDIS